MIYKIGVSPRSSAVIPLALLLNIANFGTEDAWKRKLPGDAQKERFEGNLAVDVILQVVFQLAHFLNRRYQE